MVGKINSGDLCTVSPMSGLGIMVDDIVLCSVNKKQYLHIVKEITPDGRFLIGNNKGSINGYTRTVYGVLIKVEK